MTRWAALLRGINVGGANRLSMVELCATMDSLGFGNVVTHVQSGNVVFDTDVDHEAALAARIVEAIADRHALRVPVVLRSAEELADLAGRHPDVESGLDPKLLHVVLLDRAPAAGTVADIDPARFEPDRFTVGGRQVYVSYPDGSGRSKLTVEVFERAFGVTATARNLNTIRKLVELAAG